MGSMDLKLELTFCAAHARVQARMVRRLRELRVQMHDGQWLGIPAGSHDRCIMALHVEKHVQRLSRAKPAAGPMGLSSWPCIQGIEGKLLHGHWVKL